MVDLKNQMLSYTVSSVLNRDVKQYGKKFLFDGEDDTCWNSDQGELQFVVVKFQTKVKISSLQIQFQGGFSCRQIDLKIADSAESADACSLYPEDVNTTQTFCINEPPEAYSVRILLLKPTDTFGRMIVYHLKLLGEIIT